MNELSDRIGCAISEIGKGNKNRESALSREKGGYFPDFLIFAKVPIEQIKTYRGTFTKKSEIGQGFGVSAGESTCFGE